MVTVFDVKANELIEKVKEELKKVDAIKPMEWAKYVKTSAGRKKPPEQEDWWYIKAASILRQLYIQKRPVGTQRLRTKYGSTKKRGTVTPHFVKAGGAIIRKILQQLEKAGFVKKTEIKGKKGRVLTPKGKSFLDKEAAKIKRG